MSLFNKKISNYVKIVPLDLWYRFVFEDKTSFDYSGNEKDMEKEIQKFSKDDVQGYKKLVNFTEKIFDKGFTELSTKPFNDIKVYAKQIPALLKLKSYQSVYKLVSSYISNEKLKRVFSMHPSISWWKSIYNNFYLYTYFIFRKKMGNTLFNGRNWQCSRCIRKINERREY